MQYIGKFCILIRPGNRKLILTVNISKCSSTFSFNKILGEEEGEYPQVSCKVCTSLATFIYFTVMALIMSFILHICLLFLIFFPVFFRQLAAFSPDLFRPPAGVIKVRVLDVAYVYFKKHLSSTLMYN